MTRKVLSGVVTRWIRYEYGIRAIVTVPWMEYVCFLQEPGVRKQIRR